jgi:hypothetical protein
MKKIVLWTTLMFTFLLWHINKKIVIQNKILILAEDFVYNVTLSLYLCLF